MSVPLTERKEKYLAYSYDTLHWYAKVYVEYYKEYAYIDSCPGFKRPYLAIEWAKQSGF